MLVAAIQSNNQSIQITIASYIGEGKGVVTPKSYQATPL